MLLVLGFFNLIDALVAITNASYYQHVANSNGIFLPVTNKHPYLGMGGAGLQHRVSDRRLQRPLHG